VNRIDRLFAITTQLQSRRRVRATDLAAIFEVSLRTIYRDITALSESGVPIVSLPGQGYALAEGYFLPPLRLTSQEATALVLGARLLAGTASPSLANAADSAVVKIQAIIGNQPRQQLQEIDAAVEVMSTRTGPAMLDFEDEQVAMLRRAIMERRIVTLRYFGRIRAEETVRQVEPLRLVYSDGAWYLTAFCRMRNEERAFRLDRIEEIKLEEKRFPIRARQLPAVSSLEVVVRFRGTAARWAQEQQHWSFAGAMQTDEGLVASYRPRTLENIASWLLGWGASVEVLSPPSLRDRLRTEAQAVVQMLT
jgi:predicted DNA-binding transcriptional regulator YafY